METLIAFWVLMAVTLLDRQRRKRVIDKPAGDWVLDLTGLLVQGAVIPLLQLYVFVSALGYALPGLQGRLTLPGPVAFALSFVVVDYLFYWNHRLLHTNTLWPAHMVHHTMTDMDVLGTSRNTVWTSFLIVYVWINPLVIHALAEPTWYVAAVAATACLDLWRHSPVSTSVGSTLDRALSLVLITPRAHALHHSAADQRHNYGANLNLWDRLHGTYAPPVADPEALGVPSELSLTKKLLWPMS